MTHDFDESLRYSHEQADQPWWEQVYRRAFPDMISMKDLRPNGWHQRAGRDRVILLSTGRAVYVDEKVRREDWPDVLVEVWSVYPKGGAAPYPAVPGAEPGWVAEPKDCDWLAYAFVPTQVCHLFPFLGLRAAYFNKRHVWADYATRKKDEFRWVVAPNARRNGSGYDTVSIAVPTKTLQKAITNAMTITWGTGPAAEPTDECDWPEPRRPPDWVA